MTENTSRKPDPADFSRAEFPGEYEVRIRLECYVHDTIKASSQAEAANIAEAMADEMHGTGEVSPDVIEEASLDYCWPKRPMWRVMRKGKKMQTTHLLPGDLPRHPDERGF